jgi:hypothetical protein
MIDDIRTWPEWLAWVVGTLALLFAIGGMMIALLFTVYLTGGDKAGPAPTCGTSGVKRVMKNYDDDGDTLIVCNNGRSFQP